MSRPITGKQCIQARHLLRWNLRDLANRCSVNVLRIESFEKGTIRLQKPEMDYLMMTLKHQSIVFKDNFEVLLDNRPKMTDTGHSVSHTYNVMNEYNKSIIHQNFSSTSD